MARIMHVLVFLFGVGVAIFSPTLAEEDVTLTARFHVKLLSAVGVGCGGGEDRRIMLDPTLHFRGRSAFDVLPVLVHQGGDLVVAVNRHLADYVEWNRRGVDFFGVDGPK